MALAAINILALGISGFASIPVLENFFSPPLPEKISINIGVGAINSSAPLPSGLGM
jgi:hypothetical protein